MWVYIYILRGLKYTDMGLYVLMWEWAFFCCSVMLCAFSRVACRFTEWGL